MSVADESCDYEIDLEECEKISNDLFQLEFEKLNESVLKIIDDAFVNVVVDKACLTRDNNEELKLRSETNKQLKLEIENKLKEVTQQQNQYEDYKRDLKLLEQEVKKTHEAFLMARKHYKKCLNIYFSVEPKSDDTQLVFVQFFTELKKNVENYSVYLLRNTKTNMYALQSTNPTLKNFKELQRKLEETKDVPFILCSIREAFMTHKQNKAH